MNERCKIISILGETSTAQSSDPTTTSQPAPTPTAEPEQSEQTATEQSNPDTANSCQDGSNQ